MRIGDRREMRKKRESEELAIFLFSIESGEKKRERGGVFDMMEGCMGGIYKEIKAGLYCVI